MNTVVAYLLWMLGPFAGGLHLFWSRRDLQCFVWCTTGGLFLLGWVRDVGRLAEYVRISSGDDTELQVLRTRNSRPSICPPWRLLAQYLVGQYYGLIACCLVDLGDPETASAVVVHRLLYTAGCSLGVSIVGNIGLQRGNFSSALVGAACAIALELTGNLLSGGVSYESADSLVAFLATAAFAREARWITNEELAFTSQRDQSCKSVCARGARVFGAAIFFWSCVLVALYNHASIEVSTADGQPSYRVKLKDSIHHVMNSSFWQNFNASEAFEAMGSASWNDYYEHVVQDLDVEGERQAREILGVAEDAEWIDVRRAYRALAKETHPDHGGDQDSFIAIKDAYETLSTIYERRKRAAQQSEAMDMTDEEIMDEL